MFASILGAAIENVTNTIGSLGYVGIFILMALESSIVPVPSEAVLIPAGYFIYQGTMSFWLAFLVAILGSLIGSLISYAIAFYLGRKIVNALLFKYGKFFLLTKKHVVHSEKYFEEHGEITIFIGRLLPGVRHLISLPAGFSRMNVAKFSLYTVLGSGIWAVILLYIGYVFGQNYDLIKENIHILSLGILAICLVILFAYLLVKYSRKKNKK